MKPFSKLHFEIKGMLREWIFLLTSFHLQFGAGHSGIGRKNTFWRNRYKIERKKLRIRKDGAWPAVSKIQVSFTPKSITITWRKDLLGKPTWKGEIQYLVYVILWTQTSKINSTVIFFFFFFSCIISASLKTFYQRVCDLITFFHLCGIPVNFRKLPKWHHFNS